MEEVRVFSSFYLCVLEVFSFCCGRALEYFPPSRWPFIFYLVRISLLAACQLNIAWKWPFCCYDVKGCTATWPLHKASPHWGRMLGSCPPQGRLRRSLLQAPSSQLNMTPFIGGPAGDRERERGRDVKQRTQCL